MRPSPFVASLSLCTVFCLPLFAAAQTTAQQTPLVSVQLQAHGDTDAEQPMRFLWRAPGLPFGSRGVIRFATGRFGMVNSSPTKPVVLCDGPCEARLPTGLHELTMASETWSGKASVTTTLDLREPVVVEGEFRSRRWIRLAGLGVALAAIGVGLTMSLETHQDCSGPRAVTGEPMCNDSHPSLKKGLLTATLGTALGLPFFFVPDKIGIKVSPKTQ